MDETVQFNLRLPKSLIYDMEFIAKTLKISRNDWLKYKLAQMVQADKEAIIEKTEKDYILGRLDDKQFKNRMGLDPSEGLQKRREYEFKMVKEGKLSAQRYIKDLAKKVEKDKNEPTY